MCVSQRTIAVRLAVIDSAVCLVKDSGIELVSKLRPMSLTAYSKTVHVTKRN